VAVRFCHLARTGHQAAASERKKNLDVRLILTGLKSHDYLARLFAEDSRFMAVLEGPTHRFAMANAAYLAVVGRGDLIGRDVADVLPELVDQGYVDLLDQVLRTGKPFVGKGVEARLRPTATREGRSILVDVTIRPFLDEQGAVTALVIQGRDLTSERAMLEAARESEDRFRVVAENAPTMLWMGDINGHCLYLNREQRAFWGLSEDDVAAFDWNTLLHPDDREHLYGPFGRAMATHTSFTVEARHMRADGQYRILRTDGRPRFGPFGNFLGMLGVNLDVTEMRQAEAALREETAALEVLNGTGATFASELDVERLVQTVTDAGVELTGAKFGAFFYKSLGPDGTMMDLYCLSGAPREAFSKFGMPRATQVFAPTFNGDGIVRSDDIAHDPRYGHNAPHRGMPAGHMPVRSYLAVPVRSRSGEVIGGLFFGHPEPGVFSERSERVVTGLAGHAAVALDNARLFAAAQTEIESRRAAEQALHDLNASLEQQVEERTAELRRNEEALRQAQKMEAVGQLTGGVAHDFNNLLQIIVGNLETLERNLPPDQTRFRRSVDNAMNGARRASTLTQRLLAFSRRQPLDPRVLDLNGLVQGMSDLLHRTLGEDVAVETIMGAGLWRVEVDANQLENALLNLAVNARDAMENGGKLTIETTNTHIDAGYAAAHAEVKPGQYVVVCVSDTGVGMDKDTVSRVFEPFFTTKEAGKGTGLGMSQVYGFVKQSGGHVKVYSEPGHGTTVRIYLPRRVGVEAAEPVAEASLTLEGSLDETILVVEDDDDVRTHTVETLRELGYRVVEAHDGPSALRLLERQAKVDLFFTDVVLPGGLTGAQLALEARALRPDLKVLFTTGYARSAMVHHGRLDSGIELISKPFTYAALAAKVRDVLDS
jgi:PAS domain S-box-containing protein